MNKILKITSCGLLSILSIASLHGKEVVVQAKEISILNTQKTANIDNKVLDYSEKKIAEINPYFKLKKQIITKKEKLGNDPKWIIYNIDLEIIDQKTNKEIKTPYLLFSNGEYITTTMTNLNTQEKLNAQEKRDNNVQNIKQKPEPLLKDKERIKFENNFLLESRFYTKKRFIAGNNNAKTKIAIFSNPLCESCVKTTPIIIEEISKRDDVGLYYFNVPLESLYPTSKIVIQAIEAAKKIGIENAELKIYKANLSNFYNIYKTKDSKIALNAINEVLGTNLTLTDLNEQDVVKRLYNDMAIVTTAKIIGTPTILINGSYVDANEKLLEILKSK